jgi:hypothetical protein
MEHMVEGEEILIEEEEDGTQTLVDVKPTCKRPSIPLHTVSGSCILRIHDDRVLQAVQTALEETENHLTDPIAVEIELEEDPEVAAELDRLYSRGVSSTPKKNISLEIGETFLDLAGHKIPCQIQALDTTCEFWETTDGKDACKHADVKYIFIAGEDAPPPKAQVGVLPLFGSDAWRAHLLPCNNMEAHKIAMNVICNDRLIKEADAYLAEMSLKISKKRQSIDIRAAKLKAEKALAKKNQDAASPSPPPEEEEELMTLIPSKPLKKGRASKVTATPQTINDPEATTLDFVFEEMIPITWFANTAPGVWKFERRDDNFQSSVREMYEIAAKIRKDKLDQLLRIPFQFRHLYED